MSANIIDQRVHRLHIYATLIKKSILTHTQQTFLLDKFPNFGFHFFEITMSFFIFQKRKVRNEKLFQKAKR